MPSKQIKLVDISIAGGTQSRAKIDEVTVRDYATDIKRGDIFPDVILFHEWGPDADNPTEDEVYWMADGFHRWHANHLLKKRVISADVREGGQRDAILFGLAANSVHGLRRSNADKQHAVVTLLSDDEWKQWSDSVIANHCCVTSPMVKKYREKLHKQPDQVRQYTRDGKTRKMTVPSPSSPSKKAAVRDQLGHEILVDELAEVFESKSKLKSIYSRIEEIRKEVKVISTKRVGIYLDQQQALADLTNVMTALKFAAPHAVCTSCDGDTCEQCRYSGFITKEIYNRLPETAKQF